MRPADHEDMRGLEGRTIAGAYRLRELLGEGAFGGVFLTDQYVLGLPIRRVALKLSRRTHVSEENARDMLADAFLLAEAMDSITDAQTRAHLVHLYDAGITRDLEARWFLTMEYVPGTTLADQFASFQRVPAPLLVKWVSQICRALRGLHNLPLPLLHRDLKPSNVLLGLDNTVRLVDFGLAARLLSLGGVPGVAGTLAYMAPEASQGTTTPASDVYSIGLLTHEGLTGRHPFEHLVPPIDLPDALHGRWLYETKRTSPAVPPSSLNNTVPRELDEIVLRCLRFDPGDRFPDAAALLEALEAVGAGTALPPPAEQALRESRDRRAAGDLRGALDGVDKVLSKAELSREDRLRLLREKGEVLDLAGEHADAAAAFVQGWQLTANAGVLRTVRDRAALLTQIIDCYEKADNSFQTRRYTALRTHELEGGQ
jgi:eukaryotic-like serine/threonine-protein kinase